MSVAPVSDIVFFSRGKGRGHAIPDAAIADGLRALAPDAAISFVSYNVGAATLKSRGWDVIDLNLPEDSLPWDLIARALPVLESHRPGLVVSHEEFVAMPIAKGLGLPTVFLTDWFLSADSLQMQALKWADEVIVLDEPGYQDVPAYLSERVVHVGPVLQHFHAADFTRERCRDALGVPRNATVVVVVPGGASLHAEVLSPIADVVLAAYEAMKSPLTRLLWVTGGADYERLASRTHSRDDVRVLHPHESILTTMGAADVVITKGNRITTLEAAALGVASISISWGNNPLDDSRVSRISTNTSLRARGLTASVLEAHMLAAVAATRTLRRVPPDILERPCLLAARRLHDRLFAVRAAV